MQKHRNKSNRLYTPCTLLLVLLRFLLFCTACVRFKTVSDAFQRSSVVQSDAFDAVAVLQALPKNNHTPNNLAGGGGGLGFIFMAMRISGESLRASAIAATLMLFFLSFSPFPFQPLGSGRSRISNICSHTLTVSFNSSSVSSYFLHNVSWSSFFSVFVAVSISYYRFIMTI